MASSLAMLAMMRLYGEEIWAVTLNVVSGMAVTLNAVSSVKIKQIPDAATAAAAEHLQNASARPFVGDRVFVRGTVVWLGSPIR